MLNSINLLRVLAVDSSKTYSFPDIFKESGMTDSIVTKSSGSVFQRIFLDVNSVRQEASLESNFVKSGLFDTVENDNGEVEENDEEEPVDYQNIIDEMMVEFRQKEAEAYQKGIQDGYRDGFQQGHQAGIVEGSAEIETIVSSLQEAIREINIFREVLALQAERETVKLSLAIARKIVLVEPSIDPNIIMGVVNKIFETSAINVPVRIRVNPAELTYLQSHRHLIPIEGELTFIEDGAISSGGCVVESLSGDIDARIESQLNMVEESFLPGLAKNAQDLERVS